MYIFISNHCPFNFVDKNRSLPAEYHFKHFDQFKSHEQVLPFQQAPCYRQKWQQNDFGVIQVESDIDPITIKVFGANGAEYDNFFMVLKANINGRLFFEATIDFSTLPEGVYYLEMTAGTITLESEYFEVAASHPGTLLFKYSHNSNKGSLFETGIFYLLRIEGVIGLYTPSGARTVYMDNPRNSKTVKGYSSRDFVLSIGVAGIPDVYIDKVQDIFDLNNVQIDGKGFTAKDESSKLTPQREDDVAWAGWSLDITETNNRRGKRFEGTGLVEYKVAIDYLTEGKFFGPVYGPANTNDYTINTVE